MSFLDLSLPVLLNDSSTGWLGSTGENIVKSLAVFSAAMGVCCILSAFLPATYHTYKTKNTVGVNKFMFFLHLCVATCFFLGALCMIVHTSKQFSDGKFTIDAPVTGVIFAIANGPSMCGCAYVYRLKLKHIKRSAELGISEADYFKDYISQGRE